MNVQNFRMLKHKGLLPVYTNIQEQLDMLHKEDLADIQQAHEEEENELLWDSCDFNRKVESFGTGRYPSGWSLWNGLSPYTRRRLFKYWDDPMQLLGLRMRNSRESFENKLENYKIRERQRRLICNQLECWMEIHDIAFN